MSSPTPFTADGTTSPRPRFAEHAKHDSAHSEATYEEVEGRQESGRRGTPWSDFRVPQSTAIRGDEGIIAIEYGPVEEELQPLYEVRPASPTEFGQLFPSGRKMLVQHDNSYGDGAMNLRVDMHSSCYSRSRERVTVFHMKINNIEKRETSLRRYCRDSGREVCSSTRVRPSTTRESRPKLIRSLTSAFSSLGSSSASTTPPNANGADQDDNGATGGDGFQSLAESKSAEQPLNDSIMLDFSNYAHIELARKQKNGDIWHEYDYWGTKYRWKTIPSVRGYPDNCVYQLFCSASTKCVASIVPVPLTAAEMMEEQAKGSWIEPCSFWIEDVDTRRRADVAE